MQGVPGPQYETRESRARSAKLAIGMMHPPFNVAIER